MKLKSTLVWLRRDLRAHDHAALYHALKRHRRVFCAFVLDTAILDALPRADRRVEFILDALRVLDADLGALAPGAGLIVRHGLAREQIPALAAQLGAGALYFNHDDEPDALGRDAAVGETLLARDPAIQKARVQLSTRRLSLRWRGPAAAANGHAGLVASLGFRLAPFDASCLAAAAPPSPSSSPSPMA